MGISGEMDEAARQHGARAQALRAIDALRNSISTEYSSADRHNAFARANYAVWVFEESLWNPNGVERDVRIVQGDLFAREVA